MEHIKDETDMVNPLDKAGAYVMQDHEDMVVSQVSGRDVLKIARRFERREYLHLEDSSRRDG
ncbi:MAG TPA: hypothetical protein VFY06_15785 [Verrucomicrobiae bacterium]|nr:hypothetical protein [Verrucomicrobiae bacterium]